jgi:nucleotide-binding universal stress UspA family protein
MYERIVVALDGSDLAEQVLSHVAPLAAAFRATVTLVRVHDSSTAQMAGMASAFLPGTGPLLDPGPAIQVARGEAEAYLAGVEARLSAAGVRTEAVVLDGPAAEGILTVAGRRRAALIAMTTHGRGGLGRLVFGSVADAVLRAASCPVLLVRAGVGDQHATAQELASEPDEVSRLGGNGWPPDERRERPGTRSRGVRSATSAVDLAWDPVSAAHPCPVCGATRGCAVVASAGYACCGRVVSSHRIEDCGWLHQLHGTVQLAATAGSGAASSDPGEGDGPSAGGFRRPPERATLTRT